MWQNSPRFYRRKQKIPDAKFLSHCTSKVQQNVLFMLCQKPIPMSLIYFLKMMPTYDSRCLCLLSLESADCPSLLPTYLTVSVQLWQILGHGCQNSTVYSQDIPPSFPYPILLQAFPRNFTFSCINGMSCWKIYGHFQYRIAESVSLRTCGIRVNCLSGCGSETGSDLIDIKKNVEIMHF